MADDDVLIIGVGSAGLTVTLWMARLGVTARIVEKRPLSVFPGLSDG